MLKRQHLGEFDSSSQYVVQLCLDGVAGTVAGLSLEGSSASLFAVCLATHISSREVSISSINRAITMRPFLMI